MVKGGRRQKTSRKSSKKQSKRVSRSNRRKSGKQTTIFKFW